jgi:hypothetical protein
VRNIHAGYQRRIPITPDEVREVRERALRLGEVLSYAGAEPADKVA